MVLLVIVVASSWRSGSGSEGSPNDSGIPGFVDDTGLTVPASIAPPVVTSTVSASEKSVLAAPFTFGAAGPEVQRLQERLTELGFAPGKADGFYGRGTQQAVWAYKKLIGGMSSYLDLANSDSASTVTPELWSQMQDEIVVQPRRSGAGTHVEIYLPLQVMIVFTDNRPTLIAHISSGELGPDGKPAEWCQLVTYDTDNQGRPLDEPVTRDECALSKTPGGVFKFTRKVEGKRMGPLGGMYDPVYFNFGIAVHGAKEVPTKPASHGCVRISIDIGKVFPTLVKIGDRVYVWGHDGKEPEQYSNRESLPDFNKPNPNSTTTSSSSTTTTTTPPSTTTTTTKPPSSTTTTTKPATTTTTTTTTIVNP